MKKLEREFELLKIEHGRFKDMFLAFAAFTFALFIGGATLIPEHQYFGFLLAISGVATLLLCMFVFILEGMAYSAIKRFLEDDDLHESYLNRKPKK